MTHPTHKQYAIGFAYILAILIYELRLSLINYYIALPVIILCAKYGGLFPDIDHTWQNVKEKTVPNWIINKIIHITNGKHRSWQTHSIDIALAVTAASWIVPNKLYEVEKISQTNKELLLIICLGFSFGWLSHMLSDMMTSAGVRLFFWCKKITLKLVPKRIGKLRFNTGNEWEAFVYKCTKITNIMLGLLCVSYPLIDVYILNK